MINKIIQGTKFAGMVNYAIDAKKNARIIGHSPGVNTSSNAAIADSLEMQASMNPRVGKPAAHIILSFSPRDALKMTDGYMATIARHFLSSMGYADTQYVIVRHYDKEHPHCHVIASRVDNRGCRINDANERLRAMKTCQELNRIYGLYVAPKKERVKEARLRGMDAIRYHVMHAVKESLQGVDTWKDFADDLARMGISFRFRWDKESGSIEGLSFVLDHERYGSGTLRHDVSFTGKGLDPTLRLSEICRKLGYPATIAHESARDLYLQTREEYQRSCTMQEFYHIDEKFPDFDSLFSEQAAEAEKPYPDGQSQSKDSSALADTLEEVAESANVIVSVPMDVLGAMLMQPYASHIGTGGGGSQNATGWGDEDKKKKRKDHQSIRKGGMKR